METGRPANQEGNRRTIRSAAARLPR